LPSKCWTLSVVASDLVEAARIDRHHRPVRSLAARERAHAADFAEQVMDVLPVELVVGERAFALLEP